MVKEIKEKPIYPKKAPEQETVPQVEQPVSPEQKEAEAKQIGPEKIEEIKEPLKKVPAQAQPQVKPDLVKEKTETFQQIEDILSEGLEQTYQELPDNLKQEFKEKGEETASKIEEVVSRAKVVVYKIVELIKNWLSIIPGVNKFFLEQETKIKTEKILGLAEKNKKSTLE